MTRKFTLSLALWLLFPTLVSCSFDSEIIIDATSNAFRCEDGATMFFGYLGQYYVQGNGCGGGGSKKDYAYEGTPEIPMVFRWKAFKFVPGTEGVAESSRYFYAESREAIELPPRSSGHHRYEVHLSIGPRLLLIKSAIPEPAPTIRLLDLGRDGTVYQVGDVDTLYYLVRSRQRDRRLPSVERTLYPFHAIKGIELSEAQYMTIACEMSLTGECDEYLKEDAPGLNEQQRSYLREARTKAPMSR